MGSDFAAESGLHIISAEKPIDTRNQAGETSAGTRWGTWWGTWWWKKIIYGLKTCEDTSSDDEWHISDV